MSRYNSYHAPDIGDRVFLVLMGGVAVGTVGALVYGAMGGFDEKRDGLAMDGRDGVVYTIPTDAQRPVFESRDDCITDVNDRIKQLKEADDNVEIKEKAEDLCEPVSAYEDDDYDGGNGVVVVSSNSYYGPIVGKSDGWAPKHIKIWDDTTKTKRFAIPNKVVQEGIKKAPNSTKVGGIIRGGLGVSPKGGFGAAG